MTYLLAIIATAAYQRAFGDVTGAGMLLLFGPRWWLLLPWTVLVVVSAVSSWRLVVIALVGVLITLVGVTEFELPLRWPVSPDRHALRVVTYNTDRSPELAWRIRGDLAEWGADVVLLQDCKTVVADSLTAIAATTTGLTVHSTPEFCFVSRLPVESVELMPSLVRPGTRGVGRFGNVARYRVRTAQGVLPVYSLHLESPRDALWAARGLNFAQLRQSILVRGADSHLAAEWVSRGDSALVVGGDFNLSTGSAILRRDWGDLSDAFAVAGFGFGNTMFAGRFAVRIDHVLVSRALVVERVALLRDYPSEHQPVVVDLGWRGR